jgi:hypothetical protein
MPWKTIRKAANTLKGGDTAIVNPGTYNERVVVSSSGSHGSLISFEAQGTVQCQGFTVKGNYIQVTVKLTVINDQGYPSEASKTVTVNKDKRERRK